MIFFIATNTGIYGKAIVHVAKNAAFTIMDVPCRKNSKTMVA
jgi:hypothetical protein